MFKLVVWRVEVGDTGPHLVEEAPDGLPGLVAETADAHQIGQSVSERGADRLSEPALPKSLSIRIYESETRANSYSMAVLSLKWCSVAYSLECVYRGHSPIHTNVHVSYASYGGEHDHTHTYVWHIV